MERITRPHSTPDRSRSLRNEPTGDGKARILEGGDATGGSFPERFSRVATKATGSSGAFALAILVVAVWAATGPLFHYSDTWQLVINTGTTVVTFLMVFLIQRSQNKDSQAVHLKLNEIVAALEGASNRLIDVESLSEAELQTLHRHFEKLVATTRAEQSLTRSHSVEEAEKRARRKLRG